MQLVYESIEHETDSALLVQFEKEVTEWLPKSQVDCDYLGTIDVPTWLVEEKGLEYYEK